MEHKKYMNNSNMNDETVINEISKGINFIGALTYKNFIDKLKNQTLMDMVDYRYAEYGEVARISPQEKILQNINEILRIKLEGTEDENEIKKGYPLRMKNGIIHWGHSIPQFSIIETENPYRVMVIVDELLEGKNLSEAIKTIKKLEEKYKKGQRP